MNTINPNDYYSFYSQAGDKDGIWQQLNLYDNITPEIECYLVEPTIELIATFSDEQTAVEFVQNYFNN